MKATKTISADTLINALKDIGDRAAQARISVGTNEDRTVARAKQEIARELAAALEVTR